MTTEPKNKFRSATIRDGTIRATTRSFLYALGQDDEEHRPPARRRVPHPAAR